jgi:tRNA A37 methylthiotransferase MiaB
VTKQVKAERRKHLAAIGQQLRKTYFGSLVGTELRVLIEGQSEQRADHAIGTSCRYAPVELESPHPAVGTLLDVVAHRLVDGDRIWASLV